MSEELDVPHTACSRLFAVDFEVEFLLYEVRDTLLDALCCSWGLAEDYAVICIAHKRMSAFLQLLVKFIENYITKERKVSQDKPQKQEPQKQETPKQQVKQSFRRSM